MKDFFKQKFLATMSIVLLAIVPCFADLSISGKVKPCLNTTEVYTALDLVGTVSNPKWEITYGSGTIVSTNSTNKTASIEWYGGVKGTLKFTYTSTVTVDNKPKSTDYSTSLNVDIITGAGDISITPSSVSICNGNSTTLTASISGSKAETLTYTWANNVNNDSKTGTSISVSPSSTTRYTISAKDECNNLYFGFNYAEVKVNPKPVITTTGPSGSICPGQPVTLTASGANQYTWSSPSGSNIGSNSSVSVAPQVTSTFTVTGTNSFGCSSSKSVTVNVFPIVNITANKTSICPGSSATLTAGYSPDNSSATYTWVALDGSMPATPGKNISVSPTKKTTYRVTGTSNGCVTTKDQIIYVLPVPGIPTIAGPENYCINPPNQVFSVPIGNTADGDDGSQTVYRWSVSPSGYATILTPQVSKICSLDFNNVVTGPMTVSCTVSNQCGSATGSLSLNIAPGIAAPNSITGPFNVCNFGGTSSSYSLGQQTSGTEWEITPSSAVVSTTTSNYGQFNVVWRDGFTGAANIRVRIRNGCGYSAWSNYYTTNVKSLYIFGSRIACNKGSIAHYALSQMTANTSWIITPTNAATSSSVSPYGQINIDWNDNFVGTAQLKLTVGGFPTNCNTNTLTISVVEGTCGNLRTAEDESLFPLESMSASIYPNPSNGTSSLSFPGMDFESATVEILDLKGVNVYAKDNVSSDTELTIGEDLPSGIYSVVVRSGKTIKTLKFVKQN
ncbi:MAG: T9SS type A sorting domain-containing protein [Sporocytophaga sp.]|nr:T9SS type A sorting domain-containing protein [Sporocytophaga sp.]